jgi:hypothetical protein
MGADLIMAFWWTTKPEEIDWVKGSAAISYLDITEVDPDNFDGTGSPEDDGAFMDEVIRPQLQRDLEEIRRYWEGETDRATSVVQLGPVRSLISGGTSWGDDPSEMWTVMNRVPDKIAMACGFYS